jgi:hypothetical protein
MELHIDPRHEIFHHNNKKNLESRKITIEHKTLKKLGVQHTHHPSAAPAKNIGSLLITCCKGM